MEEVVESPLLLLLLHKMLQLFHGIISRHEIKNVRAKHQSEVPYLVHLVEHLELSLTVLRNAFLDLEGPPAVG